MSIIPLRKKKNPQRINPARIDSAVFWDTRLSWAAKGICVYLMATRMKINVSELKEMAPGDLYLSLAVKELAANGYVDVVAK